MPEAKRSSEKPHLHVDGALGVAFSLLLLLGGLQISCTNSRQRLAQKVVLDVNGSTMTAKDFADQLVYRLQNYDALSVKDRSNLQQAKEDIVREFLVRVLTENWAKEQGIMVKAEDLEAEVNGVRSYYPDDVTFQKALADEGLSFRQWRERLAFGILQRQVMAHLRQDVTPPSEEELKAYYENHKEEFEVSEQVHLRQIVLQTESDAQRMIEELNAGKSLQDLAKNFSITPDGEKGGDLGWVDRGTLDIFDEAFVMRVNQRSDVKKSPYGFHIFELLGKRSAQTRPFAEIKGVLERRMMENREQARYSSWLESQIRQATVFKDEEFIAQLKVETMR